MAGKVIDINIHHLPPDLFSNEEVLHGFLYSAPFGFGYEAYIDKTPDGQKDQLILEYPKGKQILNYVDGDYTLEAKIKAMDEAGVDIGILRMPVWQEWLSLETCKIVNDNAIEMCQKSNGRLYGTIVVPPYGRKEDIYEMERCMDAGMVGVQCAVQYGNRFLDDPIFKPHLKFVNDHNLPIVMHHTPGVTANANFDEYTVLRRELGRIHVQAAAVGREVYSGMFDEFPNLKLIHTMFGGNWFGLQQILGPHKSTKKKEAMNRLATNVGPEEYEKYLKNNIFFDMSHPMSWGKAQCECAVKVNGADHLLLGSSFPVFYEWLARSVDSINELDVTQEEKDLILGGNAAQIFGL